ncbi:uncharacterized protein EDB93DRAFT_1096547 [Suillus bovinus]|uniref:uncharacterized protein n=1 Tax=Suillus bovinus TaxID=48563 RepID=UPI001B882F10|nr:uncharacterized protein EDB93DRAFT_1096544 [Suillus bovinus]XP_041301019.1 uncharacterized protein EDB93DRAFT_1096547 [Suillus bovinus]KAG2127459.1 hypothetical protein EDB93DRAFT_1096544 [Suillus bovinus]KAG2127468.1 hypothetical protein EDB93DRAFT_1096547 [Suillus bovinus]
MQGHGLTYARSPKTLLDKNRRVIVVLAGQPQDDGWQLTTSQACAAMEIARERCTFKLSDTHHRRGFYPCLGVGVSYGGGQQEPDNLQHSNRNQEELRALLSEPTIQRLAGFGSSILCHYAPKVHRVYTDTKASLKSMHAHLTWNFRNSVFAAATFNLGPATVTFDHTDNVNFASGMCSITALGNFDPITGGHLVLFDLGLIIQFPPGATILIPSAILRHGNIPISSLEKRLSFTQYFAGGLVRWVEYGFRTEKAFKQQSPEAWREAQVQRLTRVEHAARYFSIFEELEKDHSEYTL